MEALAEGMRVQLSGGYRTKIAQDMSEEMKEFNRKLIEKQRGKGVVAAATAVQGNQSMNASSSNGGLANTASGMLLEEKKGNAQPGKEEGKSENVNEG